MRLQLLPLTIFVIINIIIDVYFYKRIKKAYKPNRKLACFYGGLSILLLLEIIVTTILPRRSIGNEGLDVIMWLLFGYVSFYIPKYIALIFIGIGEIPRIWKGKMLKGTNITATIVAILVFISFWWGALVTRNQYEVVNQTAEFKNLPKGFDGFKIVQFSDFHLGTYGQDTTFVSKVINAINEQHADMIVFTGDLVNRETDEAYPFRKILGRLHAKYGVFSILGNHDYGDYRDWTSPQIKEENNHELAKLQEQDGWKMLNNSDTLIACKGDTIALIGVENWGESPFPQYGKLTKAYPTLRDKRFKILLTHNPRHWRCEVLPKSDIDLTLSGHTHAMQMQWKIFGKRISPSSLKYKEWGGLYNEGNQQLYVNIGLGCVAMPMRIGATPEITVITLKRKP
jgi:predicted MPP superfamily phosphohydrolase